MKPIPQIEPVVGPEERDEMLKVVESGWITEGARTREFEDMFRSFTGAKHAVAAANGTVTLFMALAAQGLRRGDEVIVPDLTMVASPNSVVLAGAEPVFVDIEADTFCLDLGAFERAITPRTKAVMPVLFNGRSPDLKALLKIAEAHRLFVLEDAAQAVGCYREGKHLGTWGHAGSFSFSTPKIITTGQGGVLTTNDADLAQRLYEVKDFGRANRKAERHTSLGYNFKFTDFQAAMGIAQMRKLPQRLERKKAIALLYAETLAAVPGVEVPATDLRQVAPWFIDVLLPNGPVRDRVRQRLAAESIGTRPFYAPCHAEGPYAARTTKGFPTTESVSQRGLWLPSTVSLTDEDVLRVCEALRRAMKEIPAQPPTMP